jgi:hypothetical protein
MQLATVAFHEVLITSFGTGIERSGAELMNPMDPKQEFGFHSVPIKSSETLTLPLMGQPRSDCPTGEAASDCLSQAIGESLESSPVKESQSGV